MKQFLDTRTLGSRKDSYKVVSAMTSAQNPHGGQEATILSLHIHVSLGAIVGQDLQIRFYLVGGNPYGTSVSINQDGKMVEDVEAAVKYQAKERLVLPCT